MPLFLEINGEARSVGLNDVGKKPGPNHVEVEDLRIKVGTESLALAQNAPAGNVLQQAACETEQGPSGPVEYGLPTASGARGRFAESGPYPTQEARGSSLPEIVQDVAGPMENIVGPSQKPTRQR